MALEPEIRNRTAERRRILMLRGGHDPAAFGLDLGGVRPAAGRLEETLALYDPDHSEVPPRLDDEVQELAGVGSHILDFVNQPARWASDAAYDENPDGLRRGAAGHEQASFAQSSPGGSGVPP